MTLSLNQIILGDCVAELPKILDNSIHLILTDLPYGITANKWDSIISIEKLWTQFKRILSKNGVVVLTASQPFTSKLVMSNLDMFKHEWIWIKNRGSNFANTVREPFKEHEHVLIFSDGNWTYNKQMQKRAVNGLNRVKYNVQFQSNSANYREFEKRAKNKLEQNRVPSSWQKFNTEVGLHPTQKPVSLFEYLIKTYSNKGEVVLDCCAGSGTTAVACIKTQRKYICIEKDPKYFKVMKERISQTTPPLEMFMEKPERQTVVRKESK